MRAHENPLLKKVCLSQSKTKIYNHETLRSCWVGAGSISLAMDLQGECETWR